MLAPLAVYLKKYRSMLLCSIFFFYLGCGITLSLLKMDCAEAIKKTTTTDNFSPNNKVEYAVVVLSAFDKQKQRDTIRSTWMNLARNIVIENDKKTYKWNKTNKTSDTGEGFPDFIKFYFVLAIEEMDRFEIMQLMLEHERTNDLILLNNAREGYEHLSKKMLKTMVWLSENLKNLKYVIKCDDDSFVRIDLIVRELEAYAPSMNSPEIANYVSSKPVYPITQGMYWGYFNGHARVYSTGKWREKKWFLCDNYLPYALGGGYVISKHIVDYIARNSEMLSLYLSEDVSMGVWTAALQIIRVHDIRFDTEWKSRGCSDDMLVRHKQNITDMIKTYSNLVMTGGKKLCPVKTEIRKSYRYKWDVLPSECCK